MSTVWKVGLLTLLSVWAGGALAAEHYDLVIRGGRVLDPESGLDAVRDVGISQGKVAAISQTPLAGTRVIDAKGLAVAPGFIDLHAHGQQLPAARMQAFDGVTTALELEAGVLPVADFYARVAAEGRPINYGASVSWAEARAVVLDEIKPDPDLDKLFTHPKWTSTLATEEQTAKILALVEQGLREGGIGVGVLLGYAPESGHKEYYALNELAARHHVPTFTHIRYLSAVEPKSSFEAYQEMIAVAASTGAHMHICHLNSTSLRDIRPVAKLISEAQGRGVNISVEAYPYGAGSTAIGAALFKGPDWRARMGGIRSSDFELDGTPLTDEQFDSLRQNSPSKIIVIHFLHPERDQKDQEYLDTAILYPNSAIASDAMGWTLDGKLLNGDVWPLPAGARSHPRSAGTFSRFLRQYVHDRHKLTLLEALRKTSLIPAQILETSVPQMKNKGRLKPGADADVVIFNPDQVADRATFANPAQTSVGMHYVIVNGVPVIDQGKLVRTARPGKPVRRTIG